MKKDNQQKLKEIFIDEYGMSEAMAYLTITWLEGEIPKYLVKYWCNTYIPLLSSFIDLEKLINKEDES